MNVLVNDVFVEPQRRMEALEWLDKNRDTIIPEQESAEE